MHYRGVLGRCIHRSRITAIVIGALYSRTLENIRGPVRVHSDQVLLPHPARPTNSDTTTITGRYAFTVLPLLGLWLIAIWFANNVLLLIREYFLRPGSSKALESAFTVTCYWTTNHYGQPLALHIGLESFHTAIYPYVTA